MESIHNWTTFILDFKALVGLAIRNVDQREMVDPSRHSILPGSCRYPFWGAKPSPWRMLQHRQRGAGKLPEEMVFRVLISSGNSALIGNKPRKYAKLRAVVRPNRVLYGP